MSDVFHNIEVYLLKRGMYKIDLCRQIGMTANGYAEMEKRNSLKLSTLMDIARTLKVSLADLLQEEIKASMDYVPEDEIRASPNTSVEHFIKPELLEPESIDRITQLPLKEEEKNGLLVERINLLQLYIKIALEKNAQQRQQIEKLQREIDSR